MDAAAGRPARRLFDSHFHVIDPRFPLVANQGYLPGPFTVTDYLARTAALGVTGGAVVAASFQGVDQGFLLGALERLGPGFVGVTRLPASASDELIRSLDAAGVRAVRFNLFRGGASVIDRLEELAHRVFDLAGWHVELYLDGGDLAALEPRLAALPRVVIDHLGRSAEGHDALVRLAAGGARVKASGFGRVDLDVPATMRAVAAADPGALLFGTDLPSTRARRPFADADVDLVTGTLGEELAARVLHDNAVALYRPTLRGP